ncbi:uncharacterized protein LOC104005089 [Pan troglodytes]|uniref:uncharacterized protein LOC104005089 n=1 Tax=Pan troglodytes TaxID=9598 RepID=UPI000049236C
MGKASRDHYSELSGMSLGNAKLTFSSVYKMTHNMLKEWSGDSLEGCEKLSNLEVISELFPIETLGCSFSSYQALFFSTQEKKRMQVPTDTASPLKLRQWP